MKTSDLLAKISVSSSKNEEYLSSSESEEPVPSDVICFTTCENENITIAGRCFNQRVRFQRKT